MKNIDYAKRQFAWSVAQEINMRKPSRHMLSKLNLCRSNILYSTVH